MLHFFEPFQKRRFRTLQENVMILTLFEFVTFSRYTLLQKFSKNCKNYSRNFFVTFVTFIFQTLSMAFSHARI